MKVITLAENIAANGNTDTTISLETPHTRGRDATLVMAPSGDFAGTVSFSDADADGSTYVDQVAATDLSTGKTLMRSVTVPELARVTVASRTAGSVNVYLLVGE